MAKPEFGGWDPNNIPNPNQITATHKEIENNIEKFTAAQRRLRIVTVREDPKQAQPEILHTHETTPGEQDQKAARQKKTGVVFPMPNQRPQPPSKIQKQGNVIVAEELAGQLGTSPELKAEMRIDERKMAVLDDGTLAALSHFSYRHAYDGVRYWGHITEWWLTGSQGIGGLGRRHILIALANTSGVSTMEKADKPNVLARNLWNKDWKQKAEEKGQIVED